MVENRKLREMQYAERREKDWEATLARESEAHRAMKQQYEEQAALEMEAWRAVQVGCCIASKRWAGAQ